ncbi:TRAP transporter small permease [Pseudorhizobium endolithicum]|uniref:TRAP transporter small permease protein n=1 Tax=Pseudorhizobium endolithicum TaxID=1191678 RepID=A0ABM8PV15_9HYPH|nr:TRAP transporter small permease [Pseudorhizobium endolithicum]CAD7049973.1 TRAP transporter small permease [Pseudorhizobium endolithicum]
MPFISRLADKLSQALAFLGAVGVLAMMVHVCADVLSRTLTGASLPATVEIVSYYYMVLVAFLPLAWVERRNAMISVELIEFLLTPRWRQLSDMSIAIFAVAAYAVMAHASWLTAVKNYETGTFVVALQTKIITWPGYFLPPAGFALAAVVMVIRLLDLIAGNRRDGEETEA